MTDRDGDADAVASLLKYFFSGAGTPICHESGGTEAGERSLGWPRIACRPADEPREDDGDGRLQVGWRWLRKSRKYTTTHA